MRTAEKVSIFRDCDPTEDPKDAHTYSCSQSPVGGPFLEPNTQKYSDGKRIEPHKCVEPERVTATGEGCQEKSGQEPNEKHPNRDLGEPFLGGMAQCHRPAQVELLLNANAPEGIGNPFCESVGDEHPIAIEKKESYHVGFSQFLGVQQKRQRVSDPDEEEIERPNSQDSADVKST